MAADKDIVIENPLGIPTLVIQPDDFEQYASQPALLQESLKQSVEDFFDHVAQGNVEQKQTLSKIFAEKCSYIVTVAENSARNKDYTDCHSASLRNDANEPICGIVVAPRNDRSVAKWAADLSGIDQHYFKGANIVASEDRALSCAHEFAHAAGVEQEQYADKIAAIMLRQTTPDTQRLPGYADERALDAIFAYEQKFPDGTGRNEIYGWPLVDQLDSVIAMTDEDIQAMDATALQALAQEPSNQKLDATTNVAKTIQNAAPDAFKQCNLEQIAPAVKNLLSTQAFGAPDSTETQIATRFLQAVERTISAATPSPTPQKPRQPGL